MRVFISYRFTGENPKKLEKELGAIKSLVRKNGHQVYCAFDSENIFRRKKFTKKQILTHSLKKLEHCTTLLVYIKSNQESEGMLLEIGFALAKKKRIILLIKKGVKTHFIKELASQTIEFKNLKTLQKL